MDMLRPTRNRIRRSFLPVVVAAATVGIVPAAGLAHTGAGLEGGLQSGFLHPLTGPDHLLAMFAVGIWGAQMGGRLVWMLPVAFPLVMTVGAVAGLAGLVLPGVEIGIALSVLVLGLAIAAVWHPAEPIAVGLIAVFAFFHGYAHGVELPRAADQAAYVVGFVLSTGLIHVAGIVAGLTLQRPFGGVPARALGAFIAVGGIYFAVA